MEFTATVKLSYDELSKSPKDIRIILDPDGKTPVMVVMEAAAALGAHASTVLLNQAGIDVRDQALALMFSAILRGRTDKVESKAEVK